MKNKFLFSALFIIACTVIAHNAFAQESRSANSNEIIILSLLSFTILFALIVLGYSIYTMLIVKKALKESTDLQQGDEDISLWEEMKMKITGLRPMREESEIVLDHEYDGIRELDNHLPPWWTYLFYLTIAFSVVYVLVYHVFDIAPSQEEEYRTAMQQAEVQKASAAANIDVSEMKPVTDDQAIAQGQEIYISYCSSCHGQQGGGGIGPNLTDRYWIHGGSFQDIYATIKNGVPQKGMISWEGQLSPTQMQNVSSYILTLEGSNPPNAKEPQGELYEGS